MANQETQGTTNDVDPASVDRVVMRRPIPPNVWISVDESMPPIGMDCLVYMPKAYTKIGVETCYNDGRWCPTWADGWKKGQRYEITHWMMVMPPTSG